ncbi:hypothetical protein JX265_006302 [Neoarthrinium moseri]|uniref:Uncharacterized protein n=1 Tax=Neoarthrinium moseri TaxID=1658444 RepID=A0A9P9WLT8_9PEZI|nr:uncharacterized protein JN550_008307 [Neoarthrinium moseri]KAI1852252.1 hypothetical protein JX266_002430 [Neoarthrinium moseri]KAI1865550.1 hypothetical protein JN550_008307 [Neoarthrinium moseri]KAI1870132.1 hypothetical protein JX265_006302 [Neoarthrinium moseri]
MKLYHIGILDNKHKPAVQLCAAYEDSDFSRWARNDLKSGMKMLSKVVAERTKPGQRINVQERDYMVHCFARSEGIAAVAITKDYPSPAAQAFLSEVLDDFLVQNGAATDCHENREGTIDFPLEHYLQRFQDPEEDTIVTLQKQLDDTKGILHKTIESMLERGTKLDDLVAKSSDLSAQSKFFYKNAKRQNSCC